MKPPSEAVAETPTLIALPPWPVLLFAALGFCGMADTVGRQIAGMLHGGWGLLSLAGAALSLALSAWILLMVFHGRARGFQLFLCYFTVVLLGYGTLKGVLNMNTSPLSISWGETAAAIAGIGQADHGGAISPSSCLRARCFVRKVAQ